MNSDSPSIVDSIILALFAVFELTSCTLLGVNYSNIDTIVKWAMVEDTFFNK